MRILIIIFLLAANTMYADQEDDLHATRVPFKINQIFPDSIDIDSNALEIMDYICGSFNSAQKHYPCMVDGITYYVCVNPKNIVLRSVIVHDADFISPEGLKVGDLICKALPLSDYEILLNDYYTAYCVMPSGWHVAASTNCESLMLVEGKYLRTPPCDRSIFEEVDYLINLKIDYIWKRQGYSDIQRDAPNIHVINVDSVDCQTIE